MRFMRFLVCFVLFAVGLETQARTHMVRPGDSMDRLTELYGVSAAQIQAANGLATPTLPPGVVLQIPATVAPPMVRETRAAEPVSIRPATQIPTARPVPVEEPALPPVMIEQEESLTSIPAPAEPVREIERREPKVSSGDAFSSAIERAAGTRYNGRWTPPGENGSWVMDCSNTARWLQREVRGVELPRTASDQYEWLRKRRKLWKIGTNERTLRKKLQPGDLLFWENTYKPVRKPAITHVMTYLGTDSSGRMRMAGSQSSKGVNVYTFKPGMKMGGYNWFLWFRREGKFVAYGRP